jgi:nicotinamide riboside kinase
VAQTVIAITGAQGVGKSTLVADLFELLSSSSPASAKAHFGIGSLAARSGVPLGQKCSSDTILEFARLHVQRELELPSGMHILDRCFIDLMAYCRLSCNHNYYLSRLIEQLTIASMQSINVVVFVPIVEIIRDRATSNESAEFRSQIDAEIRSILKSLNVRHIEVMGSTSERVEKVCAALALEGLSPHVDSVPDRS